MASVHPLRRCLARPALPVCARVRPVLVGAASLSTSRALAASNTPPAIKSRRDLPRPVKNSYKKSVSRPTDVKKPHPGERKAFRKRIQLSNNSALPVQGTEAMMAESLAQDASAGKMLAIPNDIVDQLRLLEAFKPTQSWGLFRQPHFLVRPETVRLAQFLERAGEHQETFKGVISGRRLSGKSLLLLQAMAYGLANKWVVVSIPEAQDLTNGQIDYSPLSSTDPMQFTQPTYCLQLLQAIHKANKEVLEQLRIQQESSRLSNLKQGASLADLAQSAKDSEYAWPTLTALWSELMLPGRPPVLFCLDGLAHINKISEYRDPSFKPVHSHDLTLVRLFVDLLSGKKELPNGGAVLAATSENNTLRHPSQELALSQLEAGQAGREVPGPNPYERKYDQRVYDALKNSYVMRVDGVSKDEARVLMEYWGASGLMRKTLSWHTVSEKWALGGHGLVGEMERASLMTMRM